MLPQLPGHWTTPASVAPTIQSLNNPCKCCPNYPVIEQPLQVLPQLSSHWITPASVAPTTPTTQSLKKPCKCCPNYPVTDWPLQVLPHLPSHWPLYVLPQLPSAYTDLWRWASCLLQEVQRQAVTRMETMPTTPTNLTAWLSRMLPPHTMAATQVSVCCCQC